jgi:hypothetical protein
MPDGTKIPNLDAVRGEIDARKTNTLAPAGAVSTAPRVVSAEGVTYDLAAGDATVDGVLVRTISGIKYARKSIAPIDVREAGAVPDAVERSLTLGTDSSAAIQAALNAAAASGSPTRRVTGGGLAYRINTTITIPIGVTLEDIVLQLGTNGMTGVRVNTRSRFLGRVIGRGTTSVMAGPFLGETGIAPAGDGVYGVNLIAEVEFLALAVSAYPVGGLTVVPSRAWDCTLKFRDIQGTLGYSEGYGMLCTNAVGLHGSISATNVTRHVLYLSGNSAGCVFDVEVDGCTYVPVVTQAYTDQGQAPSRGHTVRLKAKNVGPGGLTLPAGAVTAYVDSVRGVWDCNFDITVLDDNAGGARYLYYAEALSSDVSPASTGSFPQRNFITARGSGTFPGFGCIYMLGGADYNVGVHGRFSATQGVILYADITNASAVVVNPAVGLLGLRTFGNTIDCGGANCRGVYDISTTTFKEIGPSEITNTGTSPRVEVQDPTKRLGTRTRSYSAVLPFANIAAGAYGVAQVQYGRTISNPQLSATINTSTPGSGSIYNHNSTIVFSDLTLTTAYLRLYNGSADTRSFTVMWRVEGD